MIISSQQMVDTLLTGMQNQQQTVATDTNQLSSGQRFTTASQDPVAYEKSLSMRDMQSGITGSLSALDTAGSQLGMSQSVLSQMQPLLQRAQTLAVQMSSANSGTASYAAALNEVKALQQQFLNFANQTWQGQPLFAGTNTGVSAAFTMNTTTGAVTYNGNAKNPSIVISPTQSVDLGANGSNAAFTQAFSAFQGFTSALASGNVAGMQSAINGFSSASTSLTNLTAQVGGTLGSVNTQKATYQNLQTQVATSLSNNESADVAKAATQLNQANVALQAIYSELAKIGNISLVNYLK
jgi:flagellin-like hook-associated protein FlgL